MVHIEKITQNDLDEVLKLRVHDDQRRYVSTTAESLAQAYIYKDTAFPFAVYNDDEVVGFIMMGYYGAKDYYTLWKLLIDKDHQHKGYGRKALALGIAFMKETFDVKELYTGVTPGNNNAKALYTSMGFKETGLVENNMEELRLEDIA